jgi:hypothetical protein
MKKKKEEREVRQGRTFLIGDEVSPDSSLSGSMRFLDLSAQTSWRCPGGIPGADDGAGLEAAHAASAS